MLEDSADVLLNPNMVEAELAARNVELKKGKPGYNPYEDEEVDELGNVSGCGLGCGLGGSGCGHKWLCFFFLRSRSRRFWGSMMRRFMERRKRLLCLVSFQQLV